MPKVEVEINNTFYDYWNAQQRVQLFFGGSSSGKSVFLSDRDVQDAVETKRNFLLLRNTANTLKQSVFTEIGKSLSKFGVTMLFKENKTEFSYTHIQQGNQIICKGLDDVEKIKSFTFAKGVVTDIRIEEATEVKEDDFTQLLKRQRGKTKYKKRITLSCNPIMKTHWIYKRFVSTKWREGKSVYKDKDLLLHHSTYKDNKFLEPQDKADLENEKNPYFYDVYTLGKWGVLGDLIFTNWEVDDLTDLKETADNRDYGLDFGYASDPYAFNEVSYDEKNNVLYVLEETHGHGCGNAKIYKEVKPIAEKSQVICDSSEPKSIAELKLYGLNAAAAQKGKDSINHGIQWLQSLSKIVIDRGCQETINEFQQYQWKKTKQGETIPVPVDKNNHHIDNIRYACEKYSKNRMKSFKVHNMGLW